MKTRKRKEKIMPDSKSDKPAVSAESTVDDALIKELSELGPTSSSDEPTQSTAPEPPAAEPPAEGASAKLAAPVEPDALTDVFKRMNEMFEVYAPPTAESAQATPKPIEPQKPAVSSVSSVEILTDKEIEDGIDAKTVNSRIAEFGSRIQQETINSITPVLANIVNQQVQLHIGAFEFYKRNPEFNKIRPFVSSRAITLIKQHPEWDYPTLFNELEKEVKGTIETFTGRKAAEEPNKNTPAFAKAPNAARRAADVRTSLQKELDELRLGR